MASVSIFFTATERLIAGVNLGDTYQIDLDLIQFDRSIDRRANEVKTLSGLFQVSKLSVVVQYSIQTNPIIDTSSNPNAVAEFDMFLYSTMGGESYSITNIDDGSVVQMATTGTPSRQRLESSKLQQFYYNWIARTV